MNFFETIYIFIVVCWLPCGLIKGSLESIITHKKSFLYNIGLDISLMIIFTVLVCFSPNMFFEGKTSFDNFMFINFLFCFFVMLSMIILDCSLSLLMNPKWLKEKKRYLFSLLWWFFFACLVLLPSYSFPFKISMNYDCHSTIQNVKITNINETSYNGKYGNQNLRIDSYPNGGVYIHHSLKNLKINIQTFVYSWQPTPFYFIQEQGIIILRNRDEFFVFELENNTLSKLRHIEDGK